MSPALSKYLRSFLIVSTILTIIGIVMVYSSSYIYAKETFGDSAYFFKKQLIFATIGLAIIFVIQARDFQKLFKSIQIFHFIALVLLVCTFIEGLGVSVKGARRWLDLGITGFQPGELVKYTVSFLAISYFHHFDRLDQRGKILGAFQLLLPLALFLFQPDFGSFAICLIIISFIIFLSDFPRKFFYMILVGGILGVVSLIFIAPYRVQRFMSYIDPWENPRGSGFQVIQSFLAFANGAFWGKGIGNSDEKLFYLPEAHNDFIFSVIGEELGFIFGVSTIVFLFVALVFFGFKIALCLKSKEAFMTVSTITFAISIQALLNMGVVLGLLPTKGLNLPFISYGGSSLIANLMAVGVLISATRYGMIQFQESLREAAISSSSLPHKKNYQFDYRSRGKE